MSSIKIYKRPNNGTRMPNRYYKTKSSSFFSFYRSHTVWGIHLNWSHADMDGKCYNWRKCIIHCKNDHDTCTVQWKWLDVDDRPKRAGLFSTTNAKGERKSVATRYSIESNITKRVSRAMFAFGGWIFDIPNGWCVVLCYRHGAPAVTLIHSAKMYVQHLKSG